MKIDDAIEIIKGDRPFTFGRGKFADAVETLVDFAEWYKSQDLIFRSDVLSKADDLFPNSTRELSISILKQIPKAEPIE